MTTAETQSEIEGKLPPRPSIAGSMDDIIRQGEPIPAGEQVEVELIKITAPKEGSSDQAPDHALFKVVDNPNPDFNGKLISIPLFPNNLTMLIRIGSDQFGWDENGYFPTCIGLRLIGNVTVEHFIPKGSSEKVPKNSIKFSG